MNHKQNSQIYKLINSMFQDITLCLGGIFLLNQVDDELIRTIANSLEEIYEDSINTLKILNSDSAVIPEKPKELKPHPAIEKFLIRLEKDKQLYSK